MEVAIEQVGPNRQTLSAVRGRDPGNGACCVPECHATASAVAPAVCLCGHPGRAVLSKCAATRRLPDSPQIQRGWEPALPHRLGGGAREYAGGEQSVDDSRTRSPRAPGTAR